MEEEIEEKEFAGQILFKVRYSLFLDDQKLSEFYEEASDVVGSGIIKLSDEEIIAWINQCLSENAEKASAHADIVYNHFDKEIQEVVIMQNGVKLSVLDDFWEEEFAKKVQNGLAKSGYPESVECRIEAFGSVDKKEF